MAEIEPYSFEPMRDSSESEDKAEDERRRGNTSWCAIEKVQRRAWRIAVSKKPQALLCPTKNDVRYYTGILLRSTHTEGLVPATSPGDQVPSCELPIFTRKSSRRDHGLNSWDKSQGLVP